MHGFSSLSITCTHKHEPICIHIPYDTHAHMNARTHVHVHPHMMQYTHTVTHSVGLSSCSNYKNLYLVVYSIPYNVIR